MFPMWVGGGDGSSLRVVGLPAICSPSGYFIQMSSPVNVSCFCMVVFGNFTFLSLTFWGNYIVQNIAHTGWKCCRFAEA